MKINKVELKNYRIHKEYEQDFDSGINLLLGNNGSGKSSVLEAIGVALFNSKARSADKEIVSKGEKNGSAKVFFTGADGKNYEIECKFGSGSGVKLTSLASMQKWQGKEVYPQVSKILDIDNLNAVFFESVICAKQNQFIDIFTKNNSLRAEHFNELFETLIYDDLFIKLRDQNEKKYEEDKRLKEERKRTLAERQKNIAELENELATKNKELSHETKELEDLKKKIEIHKNDLDKYLKQKERINNKETELKNSKNNIERFTKIKEQDKYNLKESEAAREFLENNKEKFNEYVSAKEKSDILGNELQQFKNATKHYEDLQNQQQKLKEEQIKLQGNKEKEENNIKNFEEQISKKQAEQNEVQKKLDKINSDRKEKENELEKIKEQISNILTPICAKFDELTKSKENKDREILELKKAEKALSNGICPVLKGPCLAGNRQDYFENQFKKLSEEKSEIEKKLKEKIQVTDSKEIVFDEIKSFIEEKNKMFIIQQTEIKNTKSLIDDDNDKLKKIANEIQILLKSKVASSNELKKADETLQKNNIEIQELIPKIEVAKKNKEHLEKLQAEINDIKIKILNPTQKIYNECLQKTKTADEYEMRKNRLAESEKNIEIETERMNAFENELKELNSNFSEEQLKLKEEALKNLNKIHEETIKKKANLERDIEHKNKEIEEHKKIELEILDLNSKIAIIQQKIELTKIFRDKIRDMGRIVAEERVQRIAGIATDYFNKITGRPEPILWVCNESEKYSLYLDSTSFANLSGGEQISVAIAIRLALSQDFGNTGLIILDEPTNNLDQYKRQLLAENLPKMVENLSQLFVVTHDDTFRNSATKVIEL